MKIGTLKKNTGVVAILVCIVVAGVAFAAEERRQGRPDTVTPDCEVDRCTELYSYCDDLLSFGQSLCREGAENAKAEAKQECLDDGGKERACEDAAQKVWQAVWDGCMDGVNPIVGKCIESVIGQDAMAESRSLAAGVARSPNARPH